MMSERPGNPRFPDQPFRQSAADSTREPTQVFDRLPGLRERSMSLSALCRHSKHVQRTIAVPDFAAVALPGVC